MRIPTLLVLAETEELSVQVRRATASLRPRPSVVSCRSLDDIEQQTRDAGPFDVLVAGPVVSGEAGFRALRKLRATTPETQLILAFDHWRSTDLRDTVRTQALDILRLPVKDEDMRDAVEQALEIGVAMADRRPDARQIEDGRFANTKADSQGTVIAVVSPTGGCGKTFLSTNLAYYLQSESKKQTCLIDLDLQFGELATALRMRPHHTIHDLVSHNEEGDKLAHLLEEHLEQHESGIRLLSAPGDPAHADAISASDVARVIEAARSRFDYVIVDTPAALSEPVLVALEHADQIFALATLDLPSVRNLGIMLSTLKRLNVPAERIKLLLNKVEADVGIDVARVAQYFPQGFSMVIPYGREVNRSLNMGQPLLAYAPRGDVGKVLAAGLAQNILVDREDDANPTVPPRRRLAWLHKKSA